jgi:anaerobic selenocysteine-containing dehydrogenase
MAAYFVHNGFCGWSYGTPSDPQLISFEDAAKIMQQAKLSSEQVKQKIPPAQYATEADYLYYLTGKNRFLCFGNIHECADINSTKVNSALHVEWGAP